MFRVEASLGINRTQPIKMARGCAFLTHSEVKLLELRSKTRRMTVSSTVQELVQPVIDRLESTSSKQRRALLDGYLQQVLERSETGLNAFLDAQTPPFTGVYWVLPKPFIERINNVVSDGRISRDSLMNSILSNAVNMRNNG